MSLITRIVLDVLKPHAPNALEFANSIADRCPGCEVTVTVEEVDEKTETTLVTVKGREIVYDNIAEAIAVLGGSIHSIDEVTVNNADSTTDLTTQ